MKRKMIRAAAILCAFICLFGGCAFPQADNNVVQPADTGAVQRTDHLAVSETIAGLTKLFDAEKLLTVPDILDAAGSSFSDWLAFALARSDVKENYSAYLNALERHVEAAYQKENCLDQNRATEYHRVCLTVLALGGDPRAFGTDAAGSAIDLVADGVWNFQEGDLDAQGINAWIFALILLNAGGWDAPAGAAVSKNDIIETLLQKQTDSGAWGYTGNDEDVDLTAMAVQALSGERTRPDIAEAIEKAFAWLSSRQTEDGAMPSQGTPTAESTAQTVIALCSTGIDPSADGRFRKANGDLLSALERFRLPDGCFAHLSDDEKANGIATQQALLALCAAERLRAGETGVYEFETKTETGKD